MVRAGSTFIKKEIAMKTLVAYYSFTGNNLLLASYLKEKLNADILEITERKKRKDFTILMDMLLGRKAKINPPAVAIDQYDMVILTGPVWNWKASSPVVAFLDWAKGGITKYAFITLCGGRPGQQEKLELQLKKVAGRPAAAVVQLGMSDCLPEARKAAGTSHRIGQPDLEYFRPALEKGLAELFRK